MIGQLVYVIFHRRHPNVCNRPTVLVSLECRGPYQRNGALWEFPGQFYRGAVQSQGILYNPMGHRVFMGLTGSLMANLDMTGCVVLKI